MNWSLAITFAAIATIDVSTVKAAGPPPNEFTHFGTSDASAGLALGGSIFIMASDEDNNCAFMTGRMVLLR